MPDPTPSPAPRLAEIPAPVFADERATLYLGDTVELLSLLPEASIDALVTDPPYGLSFNGQYHMLGLTPLWEAANTYRAGFYRSVMPAHFLRAT
ncbi:MAG: hypothetical protein ACTINZ_10690 [Microbacterium gubbeenense]|uniref:hypothetical protein n=1 Tax=Microbacterium gubbeenense TaxID=159896 RepID=UPI003F9669FA